MIQLRGYEGCQQRINELLARMGDGARSQPEASQATPSMAGAVAGKAVPDKSSTSSSDSVKSGMHAFERELSKASGPQPLDPLASGAILKADAGTPALDFKALAATSASRYGLDPAVFQALIQTESDFNPRLVSGVGASGLAQLMPKTAEALGVTDIFDPAQNLDAGAKYLSQLMKQFGGDTRLALAAYNAGPGAVKRANGIPPFQETQDYVKKVMGRADEVRGR